MNDTAVCSFFVYGTLQRGRSRYRLWPTTPVSVRAGWVYATLFDSPNDPSVDYPAMRPGQDRVAGECWQFAAADMAETIRVIDAVEGTNQAGQPNLYDRAIIDVYAMPPGDQDLDRPDWWQRCRPIVKAFTYHYSIDPILHGFVRLDANGNRPVSWPPADRDPG